MAWMTLGGCTYSESTLRTVNDWVVSTTRIINWDVVELGVNHQPTYVSNEYWTAYAWPNWAYSTSPNWCFHASIWPNWAFAENRC